MIHKYKHPSGNTLCFDENYHRYYFENKPYETLISATTLVNKFFPKFDRDSISKKYAKKHGLKQEDVIAQWNEEGVKGRDLGNLVHSYAYDIIKGNDLSDYKRIPQMDILDDICFDIRYQMDKLLPEFPIASEKLKVAGTTDLTAVHGDIIYIYDWKIVKALHYENRFRRAYHPIEFLDDCNFNKYAVQLNLYKEIYKTEDYFNYSNIKIKLVHIMEDDFNMIDVPDINVKHLLAEYYDKNTM